MRSLPADFRRALEGSGLEEFFTDCPYVHRAGYLSWIAEPTRARTRRARIARAVARLAVQRVEELGLARAPFVEPGVPPFRRPLARSERQSA